MTQQAISENLYQYYLRQAYLHLGLGIPSIAIAELTASSRIDPVRLKPKTLRDLGSKLCSREGVGFWEDGEDHLLIFLGSDPITGDFGAGA